MSHSYIISSDSVGEGHSENVADNYSDAVLDAILNQHVTHESLAKPW